MGLIHDIPVAKNDKLFGVINRHQLLFFFLSYILCAFSRYFFDHLGTRLGNLSNLAIDYLALIQIDCHIKSRLPISREHKGIGGS